MLKHKTSVLFVNSDSNGKKTVQVPTAIILNWKKYLTVAGVLFGALGLVIGFFIYEHTSEYYSTIYKEKINRANQIRNAIDIDKAKASFESIDESMLKINQFMAARGLEPLKLEPAGGPIDFDVTDINDMAMNYEKSVKQIEYLVTALPIGLPHIGEQTSGFGTRNNPFGGTSIEGHKGIDFRGEMGAPIKVTADGEVIFAGLRGGYGNCVIVNHKNNLKTLYAHLSEIDVAEGEKIKMGHVIGKLGSTGRSTGPHLHYEVIHQDENINPQTFLNL